MPQSRVIYFRNDQDWIVEALRAAGYVADASCFGIAHMAVQAALQGALPAFFRRINQLLSLPAGAFVRGAESLREAGIAEPYDLLAFLDGVSLFQRPGSYPQAFDVRCAPDSQSVAATLPLTLPEPLEAPDAGMYLVARWSGIYTRNALEQSFRGLQSAYLYQRPRAIHPLVLCLMDVDHAICVSFNPEDKYWYFVDANFPRRQSPCTPKSLARKVLDAFSDNEVTAIIAKIYAKKRDVSATLKTLALWKTLPEWQRANAMTPEKLTRTDSWGVSWLHMAAESNEADTVKRLLRCGASATALDANGKTPFMVAVHNNSHRVAGVLLQADRRARESALPEPESALHYAIVQGWNRMVRVLLRSGMNPKAVSTPLLESFGTFIKRHNPDVRKRAAIFLKICPHLLPDKTRIIITPWQMACILDCAWLKSELAVRGGKPAQKPYLLRELRAFIRKETPGFLQSRARFGRNYLADVAEEILFQYECYGRVFKPYIPKEAWRGELGEIVRGMIQSTKSTTALIKC